jgi:hypothetical protein
VSDPFQPKPSTPFGRPDDDPGWPLKPLALLGLFVPALAIRRAQRSGDALVALRSLFMAFVGAVCLIGVVVLILGDMTDGDPRPEVSVPIVICAGVASLVLPRVVKRPLDCSSPETLAATYRTRFFLRMAFSELPALVAFAVNISFGPVWVYFVGLGFALIGMATLAPTRRHLAHDQQQLNGNGCRYSLVTVLRRPSPGTPD